MKYLMLTLSISMLVLSVACNRETPDDIQREEVIHRDDVRETDSYDSTVPLKNNEDTDVERDVIDDEVEIDD